MDTFTSDSLNLHFDILPTKTKKAFDFLSQQKWFKESSWYLAGGTALALQVGHRKSIDLDFFTQDKSFDANELLEHFTAEIDWRTDINKNNTIYGELFGAKISFIAYPFFSPVEKFLTYGSIKMLKPADIAVMKIIAISQRGKKRDFFDLYWLAHNGEVLEETISKLKNQYPFVAHDYHHILKSLVYFIDAEKDAKIQYL
jgi:predicted nucleotidyltransferase component of viral defense system